MAQNIYDDPTFFEGYSRLPRQVQGLDGAPEWPALRDMLPEIQGKQVVDLGCGFGWVSRWMRERGAASVLGIDLSQSMIERARRDTNDEGIEYRIGDLEGLQLPSASFDVAFSSLAFHYVRDFDLLTKCLYDCLRPGGWLIFSIEHPIFMAAAAPGWITVGDNKKTWPIDGYALEGKRQTDWFVDGVIKYHRRLSTTLNTLIGAGFAIRHLDEFAPTADQVDQNPSLAEELWRPMMLLVSAQR